jgi:minor extracellular serine protease Vpr
MKKIVILVAVFTVVLFAQVVPGRYVIELAGEPAAGAKHGMRSAMRESEFAARRAAVRQTQAAARSAVANLGGKVIESMDTVVNALIVTIPDDRMAELSKIPGVVRVHAVRRVRPLLNHALPLHKVPDAWSTLPQGQNSAGAGMKIGMIDTGIDVTHPAFSDSLPALSGFPQALVASDLQFTNAKIIVAKNYTPLLPDGGDPDADDYDGHGTGTSMAAAGGQTNSPFGPLSGVAPKAYLGSYKVLDANGGTSDVIAKGIDDAVADGMDVLNISLGSYVTSYSDIDPSEIGMAAIENATKAGVIVVVAAGNSGPGASTIGDYASAPDAITAGAISNDRSLGYSLTVPGVSPYEGFPGDGPDPGQAITGPLSDVANIDPTGLACSPLPAGSVSGSIVLIGRGTCSFESKVNNAAAGGAIAALIYDNSSTDVFSLFSSTVGLATLPTMFTNLNEGTDLQSRIAATPGLQATLDFVQNS